jgi:acyl transferase domain-containing protein/acyl carrier protein
METNKNNGSDNLNYRELMQAALLKIEELQGRLDTLNEPIAVISMACRFPGGGHTPESFWNVLEQGVDTVMEVPSDRWDVDAYYDANPESPGKMYMRQGGFLDEVDSFDPHFFGISPREAEGIDPQQRLLLEVSWEALERAGLAPDRLLNSQTGVFVGFMNFDYAQLQVARIDVTQEADAYIGTGSGLSFPAGRLSYTLGLQGPSMAVATACSSSLVSLHLACQSLRAGECDLALAGGVNLILTPHSNIILSRMKALAPDGRCKTFSAAANGYGRGEGCGMVVLKRLSDALDNNDPILAVIRGSAVNHDGPSGGLTVPNGPAQEKLLRQAIAAAGVTPGDISYIEAHGTGTPLGDPLEIGALVKAMAADRPASEPLMVGSVKTNIGHLEAAAGIAGFIKVLLALQHQKIPPHLHVDELNPHIPWQDIPLAVPTEVMPWSPAGNGNGRRLAGISSFGLSGINAHIIVEEAPESDRQPVAPDRSHHILTLSGRTETALHDLAGHYSEYLSANPDVNWGDICYTTNWGRTHLQHRLAVVSTTGHEAREKLSRFLSSERTVKGVFSGSGHNEEQKVAFLFTGQGSQYVGMGRQLYETQPTFRNVLDTCDEILRPHLEESLLTLLYSDKDEGARLHETAYTQPALFALEYALAQLWLSWGIEPDIVMGHSIGEYVAACVAGVFSLEDGLILIAKRGRLMQALARNGRMATVFAEEAEVAQAIEPYDQQVSIAAVNTRHNVVISGEKTAVQAVIDALQKKGFKTQDLIVSHAFHSPLMEPVLADFKQAAAQVDYALPQIDLITNLTGELATDDIASADYWCRHIRAPVRFAAGMNTIYEMGANIFVEIGPQPTLLAMGRSCLPRDVGVWLPSLRKGKSEWEQLLSSLGQLYGCGLDVAWDGFERDYRYGRQRVVLPTTCFQRQRYWVPFAGFSQRATIAGRPEKGKVHPLLGRQLALACLQNGETVFEAEISQDAPAFLNHHRVYETAVLPAAAYIEMALSAGAAVLPSDKPIVHDLTLYQALLLPDNETRRVQLVLTPDQDKTYQFEILSLATESEAKSPAWTLHAAGNLSPEKPVSAAVPADLDTLRAGANESITASDFYQQIADLGVQYGPGFQALKQVYRHGENLVGRIQLPAELVANQAAFTFHPVLLDACFQLLWASSVGQNQEDVYLPTGIEQLIIHQQPGTELWAQTQLQSDQDADGQAITIDIHLFDNEGDLVAQIIGLTVSRASREVLLQSIRQEKRDWLYKLDWLPVDGAPSTQTETESWLIFLDKEGIGQQLAAALRRQGAAVITVRAGQTYSRDKDDHYTIHPAKATDYQQLIQEISAEQSIQGVIHLWSLVAGIKPGADPAGLQDSQHLTCGTTLHLVQALILSGQTLPRLWLVTRGGQSIQPGETVRVEQASLWGLGRVIALEHPDLHCTRLDLDPSGSSTSNSELLLAEINTPYLEDQVAYRQGVRYAARLEPDRLFSDHGKIKSLVHQKASYLVTGGLGALGLQVAKWLAGKGAQHIILTGRRGVVTQAQEEAVQRLQQAGVHLHICQADVAQHQEVADLLNYIEKNAPPLRGVFHVAGVLDDGVLTKQTWDRFQGVMAPKVEGSWNLHRLTQALPLDFFVCFSSVASLLGAFSQGSYAAANAFMDGLVHYRRALGLPGLSINWGPWADAGMWADLAPNVTPNGQNNWLAQAIDTIAPEQGLQIMEALLQQEAVQSAVLPINWDQFFGQFAQGNKLPFLKSIRDSLDQSPARSSDLLTQLRAITVYEQWDLLTTYVCTQLAEVLGLSSPEQIEPRQRVFDLGLDSLMAIGLRNQLEMDLECSLDSTLLFNYPTIEALVTYLAEEVLSLEPLPVTPPKAQGKSWETETVANLLESELQQISDVEAEDLLLKELRSMNY